MIESIDAQCQLSSVVSQALKLLEHVINDEKNTYEIKELSIVAQKALKVKGSCVENQREVLSAFFGSRVFKAIPPSLKQEAQACARAFKAVPPLSIDYSQLNETARVVAEQAKVGEGVAFDAFCRASDQIKFHVLEAHKGVLQAFFEAVKKGSDERFAPLSELYNDMTYGQFVIRLATARYQMFYGDGRFATTRRGAQKISGGMDQRRKALRAMGSTADTEKHYLSHLCPAEMAVSHLVSLTFKDKAVGTGYRPQVNEMNEMAWRTDAKRSVQDEVCLGYPVGVELRAGESFGLIADGLGISAVYTKDLKDLEKHMTAVLGKDAYTTLMKGLYGPTWSKQSKEVSASPWQWGPDEINMDAWQYRTQKALETYILSVANYVPSGESAQPQTLILKGIGLGAFGLSNGGLQSEFVKRYLVAAKAAVAATPVEQMNKFSHIEVSNHHYGMVAPKIKDPQTLYVTNRHDIPLSGGVEASGHEGGGSAAETLTRASMPFVETFDLFPLMKRAGRKIARLPASVDGEEVTQDLTAGGETGQLIANARVAGICACGDAGSMHGNEINDGVEAFSSDDPSTLRTMENFPSLIKAAFYSHALQAVWAAQIDSLSEQPETAKNAEAYLAANATPEKLKALYKHVAATPCEHLEQEKWMTAGDIAQAEARWREAEKGELALLDIGQEPPPKGNSGFFGQLEVFRRRLIGAFGGSKKKQEVDTVPAVEIKYDVSTATRLLGASKVLHQLGPEKVTELEPLLKNLLVLPTKPDAHSKLEDCLSLLTKDETLKENPVVAYLLQLLSGPHPRLFKPTVVAFCVSQGLSKPLNNAQTKLSETRQQDDIAEPIKQVIGYKLYDIGFGLELIKQAQEPTKGDEQAPGGGMAP